MRAAAHYNFTPDAMMGLGFVRAHSWPFGEDPREGELRIGYINNLRCYTIGIAPDSSIGIDLSNGGLRGMKFRIQITTPLNNESMEPGTYFLNFYNEFFVNIYQTKELDQNRLYAAGGYQFSRLSSLQLGMLWQARTTTDIFRLQIFLYP